MSKKEFTKGKANQESLGDRMKRYEAITTEVNLIERLPIYARIDMRAGHTWCRGLDKPFDEAYANAMKAATSYIIEKAGAILGYCQSDEASFCWVDHTKVPFETRLFKLQSVLASMFTGAFIKACLGTKLEKKLENSIPAFDCRVMNLPSLTEAANMFLWREKDSIKNSITLLALESFSNNEIHKKNGDEKIEMLKTKGIDYFKAIPEDLRCGAYFRRELYNKELSDDELKKIPEKNWPAVDENGKRSVIRSHVVQFSNGMPLFEMSNKVEVLFSSASPMRSDVIGNIED